MAFVLCYTRKGSDKYRELRDSMHLALSGDGKEFTPLRNNTGVLFPRADMSGGRMAGQSKTLLYPWLFRFEDGAAGVIAVRRNSENKPDTENIGCAMIYKSNDLVEYELTGFVPLESMEVKNTRCRYEKAMGKYRIEWDTAEGTFGGYTEDFKTVSEKAGCVSSFSPAPDYGIEDAAPGNVLEVSEDEAETINKRLGRVFNTGVKPMELKIGVGDKIAAEALPKATCLYNDGSQHELKVDWDTAALDKIDTAKPGKYSVSGKIVQKIYPFPFIKHASDPCVFKYFGKYYFTSSNAKVVIRQADTIDALQKAEPIVIREREKTSYWAQEMHVIKGIPYIFTSECHESWTTVQSVILRCDGSIENPSDWSEPYFVVKKDGSLLNKDKGICLDMTYFCLDGVHYVSWSNRDLDPNSDGSNEYGTNGSADVYIATIDPDEPWKLTSDPVCLCRPVYGWDRIEAEVDEGPYLLRRGDDLFITFSGSSVGVLYVAGLLHAKYGSDLLDPESWKEIPYPILTSESFPDQYGPGHNNFIKDPENPDDDLIVLLYRPLPEGRENQPGPGENPRHAAIRRVHWNATGYPNIEMTPEEELDPRFADVSLTVQVI